MDPNPCPKRVSSRDKECCKVTANEVQQVVGKLRDPWELLSYASFRIICRLLDGAALGVVASSSSVKQMSTSVVSKASCGT